MGMFDYVNVTLPCFKCSTIVTGFQSKDGDCQLHTLEYWQVDNFYTKCDNCNTWINYTINRSLRPYLDISAYSVDNIDI